MERAQEGEPWAIEALFRAHIVELTETITQLVGQEADADDIVQEGFCRGAARPAQAATAGGLSRVAAQDRAQSGAQALSKAVGAARAGAGDGRG